MSSVASIASDCYIELQNAIARLNRENLEDSIVYLLGSSFTQTEDGVRSLVSNFIAGGQYHPDSIPLIVTVIVRLVQSWSEKDATKGFPGLFREYFMEHVFHRFSFRKAFLAIMFFLFHIHRCGVLEMKEIVEHVEPIFFAAFKQTRSLESEESLSPLYITAFLSFFGPVLERDFPEFFKKCNDALTQERATGCYIPECIEYSFFNEYKRFRENDWSLWNMELGDQPECVTMFDAIRQDNVNMLQMFSSGAGFDSNARAAPSVLEPSVFMMNSMEPTLPTLLQTAAYHRAIKCFKFLVLNGAKMDVRDAKNRSIVEYALAGGNVEIIRNVQQQMEIPEAMVSIPVEFHYFNVFEWLFLSHFNITEDMTEDVKERIEQSVASLLRIAAAVNNIEVLRYVLQKEVDVNAVDELRWTALHYAADNGHYETVVILLQVPGILLNPQSEKGWSPLHRAAMMGHFRVLELLLKNPKVDVNMQNYSGVSFMFIAPLYIVPQEMGNLSACRYYSNRKICL